MLKSAICLILGFLSGYLVCQWIKVQLPFYLPEFMMHLVLNPLKSFFSMLLFTAGFMLNAYLLKEAWRLTIGILLKNEGNVLETAINYCVFIQFYILFQIGFWQTLMLAGFTVIYGLATINRKRYSLKNAY